MISTCLPIPDTDEMAPRIGVRSNFVSLDATTAGK
jgi:hypothetical protein